MMNIGVVDTDGKSRTIALPEGSHWTVRNGREMDISGRTWGMTVLECGDSAHLFFDSGHYKGFYTMAGNVLAQVGPGNKGRKIIVLSDPAFGGGQETIDLPDGTCWQVVHGYTMNHLHSTHGFDHFFNFDGTYDGWGGRVGPCAVEVAAE